MLEVGCISTVSAPELNVFEGSTSQLNAFASVVE
jgi:hypothetical protein